jgi:hypothetical protein
MINTNQLIPCLMRLLHGVTTKNQPQSVIPELYSYAACIYFVNHHEFSIIFFERGTAAQSWIRVEVAVLLIRLGSHDWVALLRSSAVSDYGS